jgi:ribose transport system substrate-binding protein
MICFEMLERGGKMSARLRLAAVTLVALGLLAATLTTVAMSARSKTYNVAWFSTKSNRFLTAELSAINKEAKKRNVKITVFDSGFDPNKQFSQIQDALTLNKFDGFMIIPLNGGALVPLVEKALSQGIKVIGENSPLGPDPNAPGVQIKGVSAQIWTSTVNRGKWMTRQMVQACRGINPCNVAYLAGVAALPIEQTIKHTFEPALKKYSNIHEIAYLDGTGFTTAGGQKVAQDLLTAHPDVNVIAAQDQAALGVELALKAAGKSYGTGKNQIRILGIGTACNTLQALKQGRMFNTQPDAAFEEGRFSLNAMADALSGKLKKPVAFDPILKAKIPVVFTKANASKRKCQY